ncbi:MAG: hypothetical protein U0324_09475 [Polyangiales bacterium]
MKIRPAVVMRCPAYVLSVSLGAACVGGDAAAPTGSAAQAIITDDSVVRMTSPAATRAALINYVWGTSALPTALANATVSHPVSDAAVLLGLNVPNLLAVDELRFDAGNGVHTSVFELKPQSSNGRAVVVHVGHNWANEDRGPNTLASLLVANGYTVFYAAMPCWRLLSPAAPNPVTAYPACPVPMEFDGSSAGGGAHNNLFNTVNPAPGHAQRYFLEQIARAVNVAASQGFTDINMAGLSGGGWTTAVYAALDPRVRLSFAVNGGKPLYMRRCTTPSAGCLDAGGGEYYDGDREQMDPGFFNIAGYLDVYALAANGAGRRHVQIQKRDDPAFGAGAFPRANLGAATGLSWDQAVRAYETKVQQYLVGLGPCCDQGSFRVEIDEDTVPQADQHTISVSAQQGVILAELEGQRVPFGAITSGDVRVRGLDRTLRAAPTAWSSITNVDMGGAPAVVGTTSVTDVFVRHQSGPTHPARVNVATGAVTDWGGVINSDPVAVVSGGQIHMVAVGTDRRLWHWPAAGAPVQVAAGVEVVGRPALVSSGANSLDAFVRRTDGGIQHMAWRGSTWTTGPLPGSNYLGFPAAVVTAPYLRVYGVGGNRRLWEAYAPTGGTGGAGWALNSLASVTAGSGGDVEVGGSPSAAVLSTGWPIVTARTAAGGVAVYRVIGGAWQYASWAPPAGTTVSLSPLATATGVFARAATRHVWWYPVATPAAPVNDYGQID